MRRILDWARQGCTAGFQEFGVRSVRISLRDSHEEEDPIENGRATGSTGAGRHHHDRGADIPDRLPARAVVSQTTTSAPAREPLHPFLGKGWQAKASEPNKADMAEARGEKAEPTRRKA
jgi:hypothetical protein